MTQVLPHLCCDCGTAPALGHNLYCAPCRSKQRSIWREEHTRKPGDTRPGWLIGDACRVTLRNVEYKAAIIDMSDVSRRDNDYDLVKLELTKTVRGFNGQFITQSWTHPEPVQTYKLRKPLLK